MDLLEIMALADERGASDIHIAPLRRPSLRLHGEIMRLGEYEPITPEESESILYGILRDDQRLELDKNWEIDFSYEMRLATHPIRFRVNMFRQNRGIAAVFRLIPYEILSPQQIGLENQIAELTKLPRGLVLVTGPTGSGKTTTLATMLDMINARDASHILTIEDPIEFVYQEKKCVISQRELSAHTKSFSNALRSALREDPDVILVGEMRDLETISLALTAAETGHLVFATLHTTDAPQTVDRVIDVFPPQQQAMVRTQLGGVLAAVVCQTLLPKIGGKGRVAAREIMISNPAIAHLIRDNQTHQLAGAIATGITKGMCPLELSLATKVIDGIIEVEDAMAAANRPHILEEYLKTKGGIASVSTAVDAAAAKPGAAGGNPPKPAAASGFMSWGRK
ncbi:MAG: type IV pilus twitching motility protein PilT [Kiritimatiellia bacterium]